MRFFLLLIFFLFSYADAQYSSIWFDTDNGLPQNSIKDIVKDKYGFIWLSTDNGIVKYDGNQFVIAKNHDLTNYYFGVFVGNIQQDSIVNYNNLDDNSTLINKRKFTVNDALKTQSTTYRKGKSYTNFYLFSKHRLNKDKNYFIRLSSGMYYFHKDLIIYENNSKQSTNISLPFDIENLKNMFVHDDVLFIANPSEKKVLVFNKGILQTTPSHSLYTDPESKFYWNMLNKQVFLVNKDRIYKTDYRNGQLKVSELISYKNFGHYSFCSMYYDKEYNTLYLGSYSRGLNVLKLNSFLVSRKNDAFDSNIYYASLPFGNNTVITEKGNVLNHKSEAHNYNFQEGYKDKRSSMIYDSAGNILFDNDGKLVKRYKNTGYKTSETFHFKYEVRDVYKSQDLYMLSMADQGHSYLALFKDEKFTKVNKLFRFKNSLSNVIHYDRNHLLVGNKNGLFMISLANDKIEIIKGSRNIPIKAMTKTSDGRIWVTTMSKGLFLLKGDQLIGMPIDPNKFMLSAHCILEDRNGGMWISTNNGLIKVMEQQLLQYAENKENKVYYYRYTKKDGFITNEFNGSCLPCGNILENGYFVFPSLEGMVFFKPENVKTYYPNPKTIYVERAKVNGIDIPFKDTLRISNEFKNGEILIDFPYYANRENIYIEANLSNNSNDWNRVENSKFVINDLQPGEYALKVRVLISPNGNFFNKTINFVIEPKFYQTFLFRISIVILFILIILWIINVRTSLLKSKNILLKKIVFAKDDKLKEAFIHLEKTKAILKNETEYQQKIIETISHDIATPIKYLSNLSKNLYETDDIDLQRKYFDSIYKSSAELYKFTLGLREYSNLYRDEIKSEDEYYDIFELFESKVKLFREMALLNHTKIYNIADHSVKINVNKNAVSVIIHNLLDNAVKNTKNGKIIIDAEYENNSVVIKISDSGRGISQEQIDYYKNIVENLYNEEISLKKYGLGLHVVLHFVKKIGGEITFKKNDPKGTLVEVTI